MAELNLSNFIIDRILSGVGYATDGSIYFKMDQCQDTSITCGSEATEIVDNVGAPVMTLYRAKTCEISGQNAILDMNLTAFQMGTTKTVAGETNKIVAPAAEVFTVDGETHKLAQTPITAPAFIYALNDDSSLGEKYTLSTSAASATEFTCADGVITLPTGIVKGTQMFVSYEYEATAGIEIVNSAKNFPKSCKLVLKALGYNPCEKDNKLACYVIFPSFEMSPDFDLSLQAGETQAWSGKASQDYCSKDKRLMSIVVVDEDDEMF